MAQIQSAFLGYVLDAQARQHALVVLAYTGSKGEGVISTDLATQGTVLKNLKFEKKWLASLLTGTENAVKGKDFRVPSLFEYLNKAIDDKTRTRTLAFYQGKDAPPEASKTKGFGKKYSALRIHTKDLEKAATAVKETLGKAEDQGRSERYIERMVKPKLTPEELRINKTIKEKSLASLVVKTLVAHKANRELDNAFFKAVTLASLQTAEPDLLVTQLEADGAESQAFIQNVLTHLQTSPLYQDYSTLLIVDQSSNQALVISSSVQAGQTIEDSHTMQDLTATLSQIARIDATQSKGTVISGLVAQ